jgi:hypothetical protein
VVAVATTRAPSELSAADEVFASLADATRRLRDLAGGAAPPTA